jgi:hypothetical protein
MGKKSHPRKYRGAQHDEPQPPSPQPPIQILHPSTRAATFCHYEAPSPSLDNDSGFDADNFFQRRQQHSQQHRPNQHWPQSNKRSRPFPPIPQNHYAFLQKSQRLKQNLVRTFTHAVSQIEQWYPDESFDGDPMDWQLEDEVVIPQPHQTVYTYKGGITGKVVSGGARPEVGEVGFENLPAVTQRAASEAGVSGTSGYSTAEAQWNGAHGRFPGPESVSPFSDGMGSNYGIA